MDEHLVVSSRAARDLVALDVDGDDVLVRHLLKPNAGGLHQETVGLIGQA
jgi:hypothetical protein